MIGCPILRALCEGWDATSVVGTAQKLQRRGLEFHAKPTFSAACKARRILIVEGHGFSRAVNDTAKPGFSRWGTVFSVPVVSLTR
jgi:hypothetical protein